MSGYLLDTNVISETMRLEPDLQVIAFLSEEGNLWMSTVVLHELVFGVQLLAPGRRKAGFQADLANLTTEFQDRILPVDNAVAEIAALLRVQSQQSGRTMDLGDALIAGTAKVNHLGIATRNVDDFQQLDIKLVNPWIAP